jgi:lactate dehydrogenase-like 2-hydroxyacid dehydrogenase
VTASVGRVVVTHWVHPEVRDYLEGFCEALIPSEAEGAWSRERVARLAADADGLIACMADSVDEAFLAGCPRLRVISATLKGYDNFDAAACTRHGAWLTIVPDTIIALPLTDGTRHLVGSALIRRMRPGAFVVNVGRGSVVDEEAMADGLEAGQVGGYAADVFAMEDWLLPGHPAAIPDRLLRHASTLFTPHLGSAVDDVRRRMSMQAARQVRQVFEGKRPDNAVNRPATSPAKLNRRRRCQ